MHISRYVFWSCLSLMVFPAYSQTTSPPTKAIGTLYQCTRADGAVSFTSVKSENCKVIATYTSNPKPSTAALAAPGQSYVYGAGSFTCGKWIAEQHQALRGDDMQWVMGYVSAKGTEHMLRDPPDGAYLIFAAFMDSYCGTHPFDGIDTAANALVDMLRKHQ